MAATTAGALKAYIEALGYGIPVFRDGPRPGQAYPYAVVQEGISISLDLPGCGDFGDTDAEITVTEIAQVDVLQQARAKTSPTRTKNVERYALAEAIAHRLHGAALTGHPAHVHGVRVQTLDRIPLADNVVRHAITVELHRTLLPTEVIPA